MYKSPYPKGGVFAIEQSSGKLIIIMEILNGVMFQFALIIRLYIGLMITIIGTHPKRRTE